MNKVKIEVHPEVEKFMMAHGDVVLDKNGTVMFRYNKWICQDNKMGHYVMIEDRFPRKGGQDGK